MHIVRFAAALVISLGLAPSALAQHEGHHPQPTPSPSPTPTPSPGPPARPHQGHQAEPPAAQHEIAGMQHGAMHEGGHEMQGLFGPYPMSREASGERK